MKKSNILVICMMPLLLGSCYYDKDSLINGEEECVTEVSYATDVDPIFMNNCIVSGCHGDVLNSTFTDFETIQDKSSVILGRIEDGTMPPSYTLEPEKVRKISCWIMQGSKNN